jgi:hypothetical protein
LYYPVWLHTNTHFHDIQFANTSGHHTQTQDRCDNTLKSYLLILLEQCANCIFRYYKQKINCSKIIRIKNQQRINSTIRGLLFIYKEYRLHSLRNKNKANELYYPEWLQTNTQFHDIQFANTSGHHTQTQDRCDNRLKTNILILLDQSVNFIFRYYIQIINCSKIIGIKNQHKITSTIRRFCCF